METGKDHGVFLRGENGYVSRFLHKQSIEALRSAGAVNEQDCVDIDTGAVLFSAKILKALFGLISKDGRVDEKACGRYINETVRLSLYGDFLYPLAEESTLEAFYGEKPEGEYSEALSEARRNVWEILHPFRMKLLRLAPAQFIHFGTTAEILHLMSEKIDAYAALGWSRHVNSSIGRESVAGCNSVLENGAVCGKNSYLEVSYVHNGVTVGENSLLSYVDIHSGDVPPNVVLHGLKQRDGRFVARIYGVDDNPKGTLEDDCSFLGGTLGEFLEKSGIEIGELWEKDVKTHSIWDACLYPSCETINQAVDAARNLYKIAQGEGDVEAWRKCERRSLKSGFAEADPEALIAWERRMQELVRMERLEQMIESGRPASEAGLVLHAGKLTGIQEEWLENRLKTAEPGRAMRLVYYVGCALGKAEGERYISQCFKRIQQTVMEGAMSVLKMNENCRMQGEYHRVRLPLRVNWGGGWSDTPPYCNEQGGTVLNAAILLQGEMPVEVTLTRLEELKIIFESRDMGVYGEFDDLKELQKTGDPYDPFALQKAALLACGILPPEGGSLTEILTRLGGGFKMQTEVTGVPKGSGLGTSSILAAACVRALFEFMGIAHKESDLYGRVLCMEQIMSTGGGWQDQVGGLCPGIKYITTMPGLEQEICVKQVELPEEAMKELQERFCLIYTGQRRLARNLLRDVVGRYVGANPDALYALNEIQKVAALMRFELERGHIDDFAELMSRHWELSQMVDAGSTNTLINQILKSVEQLTDGQMVCGAGGGGFLQVILKKGVTRRQVHERLRSVFQDTDVDVWDCTLV
ncbi:MAG: L-fucokinase [Eisenbergiella sp.]